MRDFLTVSGASRLSGLFSVIELGAGCALPSLLSSTLSDPPSLVVITDYPDDTIMKNLTANVERNRPHVNEKCTVHARGYEWGQDVAPPSVSSRLSSHALRPDDDTRIIYQGHRISTPPQRPRPRLRRRHPLRPPALRPLARRAPPVPPHAPSPHAIRSRVRRRGHVHRPARLRALRQRRCGSGHRARGGRGGAGVAGRAGGVGRGGWIGSSWVLGRGCRAGGWGGGRISSMRWFRGADGQFTWSGTLRGWLGNWEWNHRMSIGSGVAGSKADLLSNGV